MKPTSKLRAVSLTLGIMFLASCGPGFSSPDAPSSACRGISETAFNASKKAGATSARATLNANGTVSMSTGSGVMQCSSMKGSKKICRRPNDFVIHYTMVDGSDKYVLVPKDREYRLNFNREPIPCEVIER